MHSSIWKHIILLHITFQHSHTTVHHFRSVRPRPGHKSMIENSGSNDEPTVDNNNESPRSRRSTFIPNLIRNKKKGKGNSRFCAC